MKTEIVDVSATRKEIKIEIPAETLSVEFDRLLGTYQRQVTVPGFRKGHAPASVVRTRYKKDISAEALQNVIPGAVNRAIEESGLNVIGEPDVHLENQGLDKIGQEPLSLHVHVEVLPEVALGEYKGLEAARRTRPVTEESIESLIESLRESSASLQPVEERGAEVGDTVTVDFQGRYLDPPEDEDVNAEEVDVVLGGEGVLQEFTDALLGVSPDDVRTFTVKYPEDFNAKGLAGKTIEYTATVTAVRRKEVPELTDEWVKSLGEEDVETLEQLRERVRTNLADRARFESDQEVRDQLVGKLVERHQFEVPETLVSYQANQILQNLVRDMMKRGMDPRSQEMNWEGLRESVNARAADELRVSMLLERIAEEEKIEVSDEEIEAEISAIAESSRQPVEQVRAALTKQGGERSIADRLRNRKALDLLVEHAKVSEEEWTEPAAVAEPSEAVSQSEANSGDEAANATAAGAEEEGR